LCIENPFTQLTATTMYFRTIVYLARIGHDSYGIRTFDPEMN